MSSSPAQRRRAAKYSTPERIEEWSKLYHRGFHDGDVVMLTEDFSILKAGDVGIIEIRWDSRVNSPVRAVHFEKMGVCGPPTDRPYGMNLEKLN